MEPIIKVERVSFCFGNTEVLSNISFSIRKGDFVGLVGPNGSGKTTLLKLILGMYQLQKGNIHILGEPITGFSSWKKIGYVPQKATNFSENFPATVTEVVLTGLLSTKKFPKKYCSTDQERVRETLKKVGMNEQTGRRIGELSGGQQQRVLIARALITQPELLILDEPTTGIDQATQKKFYELLGTLNKEGISILLVSHDFSRITNYVNKIGSLNKTLQFYGTHEEFCKHPSGKHDHHCLELLRG